MSQAVIISGMHRSGTSLVSSLLQRAGVNVGGQLLAANVANPRGYFEDVDFYEFQDALLHARNQTYLYVEDHFHFEPTREELDRARQLIDQRSHLPVWGWKDPRTSLFLDFWHELLPGARYVFVYRHPFEVLLSLVRRGDFHNHPALTAGLSAWLVYNRQVLAFRDQHPNECLLAHIDGVVAAIDRFAELLRSKLHIDCEVDGATLEGLYHPSELKRTPLPANISAVLPPLFPGLLDLYQQLNEAADVPPVIGGLAAVNSQTEASLARLAVLVQEPVTLAARQGLLQLIVAELALTPRKRWPATSTRMPWDCSRKSTRCGSMLKIWNERTAAKRRS